MYSEEVRASLAELPFCDCSESDETEELLMDDLRGEILPGDGEGTHVLVVFFVKPIHTSSLRMLSTDLIID